MYPQSDVLRFDGDDAFRVTEVAWFKKQWAGEGIASITWVNAEVLTGVFRSVCPGS
jgi:hypothetical protein